ncbi:hypothetical protein BAUCODRAFT_29660 [Baudoinia panamericana UAMH 10762]|uniref:DUF2293 domain-containing protein n=1 Tax=Baudoinia panamericana (strain UAMH 10762) TaxID=717646 RepID=M2NNV1_BAUPA|nr:uncharacterized protein BAUCODRAFT_29660 [Baudoinia panamericana UAMH 10762]EMD01215.1 hypothetical protein BAUCODRAFT_29660 [Baudoinia panamericana UAMH 10762]
MGKTTKTKALKKASRNKARVLLQDILIDKPSSKVKKGSARDIIGNKLYKTELAIVKEPKRHRTKFINWYEPDPPQGHTHVPIGTLELVQRCKAMSLAKGYDVYISNSPMGRGWRTKRDRVSHFIYANGHFFRDEIVAEACEALDYLPTSNGSFVKAITVDEGEPIPTGPADMRYGPLVNSLIQLAEAKREARNAILEFYPNIPEDDLVKLVDRAWQPKNVGFSEQPFFRRIHLAVISHVRHVYTHYDHLLKALGGNENWAFAREMVQKDLLITLITWRDQTEDDVEMLETLEEVINLDSDEDDGMKFDGTNSATSSGEDNDAFMGYNSDMSVQYIESRPVSAGTNPEYDNRIADPQHDPYSEYNNSLVDRPRDRYNRRSMDRAFIDIRQQQGRGSTSGHWSTDGPPQKITFDEAQEVIRLRAEAALRCGVRSEHLPPIAQRLLHPAAGSWIRPPRAPQIPPPPPQALVPPPPPFGVPPLPPPPPPPRDYIPPPPPRDIIAISSDDVPPPPRQEVIAISSSSPPPPAHYYWQPQHDRREEVRHVEPHHTVLEPPWRRNHRVRPVEEPPWRRNSLVWEERQEDVNYAYARPVRYSDNKLAPRHDHQQFDDTNSVSNEYSEEYRPLQYAPAIGHQQQRQHPEAPVGYANPLAIYAPLAEAHRSDGRLYQPPQEAGEEEVAVEMRRVEVQEDEFGRAPGEIEYGGQLLRRM